MSFSITTSNVGGLVTDEPQKAVMRREEFAAAFSKTKTIDLPPINLQQDFKLFNAAINCPAPPEGGAGFRAGLDIDVDVALKAQVGFGFTVEGHIFPPKIDKLQLIGSA